MVAEVVRQLWAGRPWWPAREPAWAGRVRQDLQEAAWVLLTPLVRRGIRVSWSS